jgi:hemoglobin
MRSGPGWPALDCRARKGNAVAQSLFEKYGGFAQISKVVMVFYDKVLDPDLVGPFFDNIDMRRQIDHQTQFIASVMGGPASY